MGVWVGSHGGPTGGSVGFDRDPFLHNHGGVNSDMSEASCSSVSVLSDSDTEHERELEAVADGMLRIPQLVGSACGHDVAGCLVGFAPHCGHGRGNTRLSPIVSCLLRRAPTGASVGSEVVPTVASAGSVRDRISASEQHAGSTKRSHCRFGWLVGAHRCVSWILRRSSVASPRLCPPRCFCG